MVSMSRTMALLSVLALGCSTFPEAPRCDETYPCESGTVCEDGICVQPPNTQPGAAMDLGVQGDGAALVDVAPPARDSQPTVDAVVLDALSADAARPPPDAAVGVDLPLAVDAAPAVPDPCNGLDDDDDEHFDEDFVPAANCLPPLAAVGCPGLEVCRGVDGVACTRPEPALPEVCNGADDDCDGVVDDIVSTPCFEDAAALTNRFGACTAGATVCEGGEVRCVGEGRPSPELCNGLDDDCDQRTDETPVDICGECLVPGGEGACRLGVRVCSRNGRADCVRAPLVRPDDARCDLVDDDCDGDVDELNEVESAEPEDERIATQCPGASVTWPQRGRCEDPSEVGCGVPHACMNRGCLEACRVELQTATDECITLSGAEVSPSPDRDADATACGERALVAADACYAACPAEVANASRFTCEAGSSGPDCEATDCAPGHEFRGARCVRIEVCNNGLDEDADGLVDGTIAPWGNPCEAVLRPGTAGELGKRGLCSEVDVAEGLPGCEDTPRLAPNGPVDNVLCTGDECPIRVTLSYDYALDREEVSNRAYRACVESGCCSEPIGARWRFADRELDAGAVDRPGAEADRCPPESYVDFSGTFDPPPMADQPVVGLSWCQARDYCAWAGKRLPTEYEWERAATGPPDARTRFPWGDLEATECPENNCCRAADVPPEAVPAPCEPDRTGICPEGTVEDGQVRYWCPATFELSSAQCVPLGQTAGSPGPSLVYANQDGASSEGVVNLVGNVTEWVNDWYVEDASPLSRSNPVGPGCSSDLAANFKVARGANFTASRGTLDGNRRFPLPPYTRLASIGFRCGRSLEAPESGAACEPGVVDAGPGCGVPGRDACAAPDLADVRDSASCPAGRRLQPGTCFEGVPTFCEAEAAADCTRLDIDTFSLNPESILGRIRRLDLLGLTLPDGFANLNGESGLTDTLEADLVTNGGDTAMYLDVPCALGLEGQFPVRLVQGTVGGDGLIHETGLPDPLTGACVAGSFGTFEADTQFRETQFTSTCNLTDGTFYLRGFSADLKYSRVILHNTRRTSLRGRFEVTGALVLITTLDDARRSRAGPPNAQGIVPFLDAASLEPVDLCIFQAMVPYLRLASSAGLTENWSCNAFSQWPGCSPENACVGVETAPGVFDRSMCTGYLFPFDFHAAEPILGTIGQEECECP